MKQKWLTIIAATAFFITGITNVQAEQVVVHKGDTLWGISKENGITVDSIKKWNNLSDDLIHPDDLLEVSPAETSEPVEQAEEETTSSEPTGKEIVVEATAYTAECAGCSGITKTGVDLNANPDAKVIAVDPAVIPLGSKVFVEGYGYATAEDIGGGINGNEIDVYVQEESDALQWGRKPVKVTIID